MEPPSRAPLEIDGSYGEGGGQILRTAVSLSVLTGRPVHVTKIRAGRRVPGLMQQHSATLKIISEICGGTLEGCHVGSEEIAFSPGRPVKRSLRFDLGTAASATLVLQAVVPAVSLSGTSLELELVGGTDVPWSPTSDYVSEVVVPAMRTAGIDFGMRVERRGYYPKGGGRVKAVVEPSRAVAPVDMTSHRGPPSATIISRCGGLPRHVAERQAAAAKAALARRGIGVAEATVSEEDSLSPGSSILVAAVGGGRYIGADSIGARGKKAEAVGQEAAEEFVRTVDSGACVDPHLADMLACPLCLATGESRILTTEATSHLSTSLHVGALFTGAVYSVTTKNGASLVSVSPRQAK